MKNTKCRDARSVPVPVGLSAAAAHTEVLTLSVNEAAVAPGVTVAGVKVQVAFCGSELFRHDNVIT